MWKSEIMKEYRTNICMNVMYMKIVGGKVYEET